MSSKTNSTLEEKENKKKRALAWIIAQAAAEKNFKKQLILRGINPELVPFQGKHLKMTELETEQLRKIRDMKDKFWCNSEQIRKNLPKFGV